MVNVHLEDDERIVRPLRKQRGCLMKNFMDDQDFLLSTKTGEELIAALIELETAFWNHVQDNTPPPLDGSSASARFLSERFPNSLPKSQIVLPDTAAELLLQYDESCKQLESITEQKQKAENLLKQMMGENETATSGDRIITWKSISQERLDSKTLKAEHPALYQKYANKTSYRRFSVRTAV